MPVPENLRLSSDAGDEYAQAMAFYNEPRWQKMSLGLERITLLLELLGNPQNEFEIVHVAGTNGKGSTCAYIDSILRASGLRCGLFTSPYIDHFEERIRVDGSEIRPSQLLEITKNVKTCAQMVEDRLGEHPTEFELMCAAAFTHFANQECNVVVCEVGLGGRLDAMNVVMPELSVVTRIGLDHTKILGETISEIASEKAGIIKKGVPVVSWPQEEEAMAVIEDACRSRGCKLRVSDFSDLQIFPISMDDRTRRFGYKGESYSTAMIADYQVYNAAVAIDAANVMAAYGFHEITADSIRIGVEQAEWPGRFEILGHSPLFVLDGAHNPQGAQSLLDSLRSLGIDEESPVTFVCGMLADKDCEGALEMALPLARRLFTYTPNSPRALSGADLAALASAIRDSNNLKTDIRFFESPETAVSFAMEKECTEGTIVSFGTLYALSSVKNAYLELRPLSGK